MPPCANLAGDAAIAVAPDGPAEVKRASVPVYRCPHCGPMGTLDPVGVGEDSPDEIVEGALRCSTCAATFPVRGRIPRFVGSDNYADSFGFQWNTYRRTQLDSFSGLSVSRDRLFGVTGWSAPMDGELVLEAGSGAGRFTEILLQTGATVFSFDYSSAVDANLANNGGSPNLHLAQADILRMPFRPGSFDKVLCLGVIQHTPSPRASFNSLARQVKPGGELVIDVYTRRMASLLQWKYVLRPVTTRMERPTLYRLIERLTPPLIPVTALLRRVLGRAGARLMPIVEYSHLGLPASLNRDWAILDTFDMYSPAHDHPQSREEIARWFSEAGFEDFEVGYGPNGVVGKGRRPMAANPS